ncbi:MAG: efflux RND transporter periplasmic adaptor subunit [Coraliomargarita sp.]
MKQTALAILILLAAGLIIGIIMLLEPEPETVEVVRPITSVEAVAVHPETVRLTVFSQGTVMPVTESDISMEVSGRIIEVSNNFRSGSFFEKGEVLLRIEHEDYEAALAMREADLARAQLSLAQEEALAEQALEDWKTMGDGEASSLTLRKPQLAQARAMVKSAEALVKRAQRDLARTQIRAPYDGLVLSKNVDLGQYVAANPANPIARIYSTELAEVRLPIPLQDAVFLENPAQVPASVRLSRETARGIREWTGRLARLEATIDPNSRLIYAIAELDEPFSSIPGSGELPMKRGLFVDAEIEGRELEAVYSIPRYALRGSDTVYVVGDRNTLQTRKVEIVKSDTKTVIIRSGLEPGELVATSPIAYFTENMPVNLLPAE